VVVKLDLRNVFSNIAFILLRTPKNAIDINARSVAFAPDATTFGLLASDTARKRSLN
jgi:hypothetical protein